MTPRSPVPWYVRHRLAAAMLLAWVSIVSWIVLAHAEDAAPAKKPPDFVPFVVDRVQYEAVMEHLNGLPFKTALPLVKWLSELEDRAKGQWEADNRPKGEETPK